MFIKALQSNIWPMAQYSFSEDMFLIQLLPLQTETQKRQKQQVEPPRMRENNKSAGNTDTRPKIARQYPGSERALPATETNRENRVHCNQLAFYLNHSPELEEEKKATWRMIENKRPAARWQSLVTA